MAEYRTMESLRATRPRNAAFGRWAAAIAFAATALWAASPPCWALTENSENVRKAIARGVEFLSGAESSASGQRFGDDVLVAIALLRSANARHPKVAAVAEAITTRLAGDATQTADFDVYSAGLSAAFLCALNADRYRPQIQQLLDQLTAAQKADGGWGAVSQEASDALTTYFALRAYWEARQVEIEVPSDTIDKAVRWLLKAQDAEGGFGRSSAPVDPLGNEARAAERSVESAAGLAALYACWDLYGFAGSSATRDPTLPPALRAVNGSANAEPRPTIGTKNDPQWLREALNRGNRWMRVNHVPDNEPRLLEYLYLLERYYSLRELADGRLEREPAWYTQTALLLLRSQGEDGSWEQGPGKTLDTAEAVLFLLRSGRRNVEAVRQFGSGTLVATTIPLWQASQQGHAAEPLDTAARILAALESPQTSDYHRVLDALLELPSSEAEKLIKVDAARLAQLVKHPNPLVRRAALRALGQVRDLRSVPLLIRGLNDDDADVFNEALCALSRVSRQPAANLSPGRSVNEIQRRDEIAHWRQWYQSVRPDADGDEGD